MGYQEPEQTATLVIDEGKFAGAEVTVRTDIILGVYEDLMALLTRTEGETTAEKSARYRTLTELLGDEVLRGWNILDGRGRPRPATPEGLRRVDAEFIGDIIGLYLGALGTVASPLPEGSPNGSTAGEPTPAV